MIANRPCKHDFEFSMNEPFSRWTWSLFWVGRVWWISSFFCTCYETSMSCFYVDNDSFLWPYARLVIVRVHVLVGLHYLFCISAHLDTREHGVVSATLVCYSNINQQAWYLVILFDFSSLDFNSSQLFYYFSFYVYPLMVLKTSVGQLREERLGHI